jgi:hypothetical protein
MPDARIISDISTHRLLCRRPDGEWFIPGEQLEPLGLLPLLETPWPKLRASMELHDAADFAATLAPAVLALALGWETESHWPALAVAWIESEPRFVEPVREQLEEIAVRRGRGNQKLRHRARRLVRS